MTREEIIELVKQRAEKLGRAPSQREMCETKKVTWYQIYKHFKGMRQAVRAAGLEPGPKGAPLNEQAMLLDWAQVVRKLGRIPFRAEYDELGRHSSTTLHARLKWHQLPHRFVVMTREFHVQAEWKDVVEVILKKFPLLREAARKPLGREWTRTGANEEKPEKSVCHGRPLMNTEVRKELQMHDADRSRELTMSYAGPAPGLSEAARKAMGLGRLIAAGMAVEILRAMETSQQSGMSNQQPATSLDDREIGSSGDREIGRPELRLSALAADSIGTPETNALALLPARVPIYGAPLQLAAMAHAPTNEAGVIFLFGILAERLGYRIERIQAQFPDCEAKREIRPGVWERVRIEFEFESRTFRDHRHDPSGCDVIVCWKHNWLECPEGLEVIELSRYVA